MKAILFDFHNTLVTCDTWLDLEINTLPSLTLDILRANGDLGRVPMHNGAEARELFQALRERARESGVEVSAVDGVRQVLKQMGFKDSRSAIEEAVAELEEHCLNFVEPVKGALSTLKKLYKAGYKMAIVSSAGWPPFVETALEQEEMLPYFSHILTSAGEGIYKSDPEIFRRACARLNSLPHETVHIGDHARYDVQTARAAGLRTIWFAAHARRTAILHNRDWEELEQQGQDADAIVHDLADVPKIVRSLNQTGHDR